MQDFIIDSTDGDLKLTTDFVIGKSDVQHQELLIVTEKSAWKENPMVGVGVRTYIENEDAAGLLNETRRQFTTDGMTVNKIAYDKQMKLQINAAYNQ